MRYTPYRWVLGTSIVLTALVACREPMTAPRNNPQPSADLIQLPFIKLLDCPTNTTLVGHAVIGSGGGSLEVGGSHIDIPAGVLPGDTPFTMTLPAGRAMQVDVSVDGVDHYRFSAPVSITMDYSRCRTNLLSLLPIKLSAWYVDSASLLPLELMAGTDNRQARQLTFSTGHLSGYILAY